MKGYDILSLWLAVTGAGAIIGFVQEPGRTPRSVNALMISAWSLFCVCIGTLTGAHTP